MFAFFIVDNLSFGTYKSAEWTVGANKPALNANEFSFFGLLGAMRTKSPLELSRYFHKHNIIISRLECLKKAAVLPAAHILPQKAYAHKQQTETEAVTKTIAVSTLPEVKKVEHRPYPYLSGLVMGILIFLILYRSFHFNSNNKNKMK